MPFYHWDDMTRKNLAKPSDSEGSIIIGENITLNRSVSQPGKVARPHFHGCEQMINVCPGALGSVWAMRKKRSLWVRSSISRRGPNMNSTISVVKNSYICHSKTNPRIGPRQPPCRTRNKPTALPNKE